MLYLANFYFFLQEVVQFSNYLKFINYNVVSFFYIEQNLKSSSIYLKQLLKYYNVSCFFFKKLSSNVRSLDLSGFFVFNNYATFSNLILCGNNTLLFFLGFCKFIQVLMPLNLSTLLVDQFFFSSFFLSYSVYGLYLKGFFLNILGNSYQMLQVLFLFFNNYFYYSFMFVQIFYICFRSVNLLFLI